MAELATLQELKSYLGNLKDSAEVDEELKLLLDVVEGFLEDHAFTVFGAAGSVTDEPYDGDGTKELVLKRLITTLDAAVKIGQDVTDADDTIQTTDIIVDPDDRRLLAQNGARFPRGTRNLFVTYTYAENKPDAAKQLVLHGAAKLFRFKGREHITSSAQGEFGVVQLDRMNAALSKDPIWNMGLSRIRAPLVWFR